MSHLDLFKTSSAMFDKSGTLRFELTRSWGGSPRRWAVFIGMNPSTADAQKNDPTVRREIGFAQRAGADAYAKLNLHPFRATDPDDLKKHLAKNPDERLDLQHNRAAIERWIYLAREGPIGGVVVAWGSVDSCLFPMMKDTVHMILKSGVKMFCLGKTKNGFPRHPLYLRTNTKFESWHPQSWMID